MIIELKNIIHTFENSQWEMNLPEYLVSTGKVQGIIGPNGSGKTTLLRIAAGIINPAQGEVRLSGKNIKKQKRRDVAKLLGYLPQELSSEYDLSVLELVRMGRYPYTQGWGNLTPDDHEKVIESLKFTGMEALKDRRLSHLSGGEKKRAFLASVLSQKPRVLLLDEPGSALDIHHQVSFFRLLQDLANQGMGIVVVTHDLNFASLFSDDVVLLDAGKCAAQGSVREVFQDKFFRSIYGRDILMGIHPEIDRPTFLPRPADTKKNKHEN